VTNRYERITMQRRLQQRIRLVVEERRMTLASPPDRVDPEATIELPQRAVGQAAIEQI
jgi:hypothetical protein